MEVLHISCNMCTHDVPDMYALRLWAYISGKSLVPMLQLLHVHTYLHTKYLLTLHIFFLLVHEAVLLEKTAQIHVFESLFPKIYMHTCMYNNIIKDNCSHLQKKDLLIKSL